MGKATGFEFERQELKYQKVDDRVRHYNEFTVYAGKRHADPGRPLHGMRRALLPSRLPGEQPDPGLERSRLQRRLGDGRAISTDQQLPEFTGRVCPDAPCERARHAEPVRSAGDDQADRNTPSPSNLYDAGCSRRSPRSRTGKKVAVIGSTRLALPLPPSSLSAAGHDVHVYEKNGARWPSLRHSRLQARQAYRPSGAYSRWSPRASSSTSTPMQPAST